jgi:hypothetical protein
MNQINKLVVLSVFSVSAVSLAANAHADARSDSRTGASSPIDAAHIVEQLRIAQHADAWSRAGGISLNGIEVAKGCAAKAVFALDPAARNAALYAEDGGPANAAEGVDADGAWQQDASGITRRVEQRDDAQNLISDVYWADGGLADTRWPARVRYLDAVQLGGATADVLEVTPSGGKKTDVWISRSTHLPLQWARQDEGGRVLTAYADYRDVGGALIPFRQTVTEVDGTTRDYTVTGADVHPKAAALKALVEMPTRQPRDAAIRGARSTTVTMHMAGQPYVDVYIDGRGPFNFRVDTSGTLTLSTQAARRLGLPLFGGATGSQAGDDGGSEVDGMQYAMLGDLRIGDAHVYQQNVQVRDLADDRAGMLPRRVDGIVGAEFMERFVATFDFKNQKLTLALAPGQANTSAVVLTQTAQPHAALIRVTPIRPACLTALPGHTADIVDVGTLGVAKRDPAVERLPLVRLAAVRVSATATGLPHRNTARNACAPAAPRMTQPLI